MNPKAQQIHDANRQRILRERAAMRPRYEIVLPLPKISVRSSPAMAENKKRQTLERNCLCCEMLFASEGAANRLCPRCSRKTDGILEISIRGRI